MPTYVYQVINVDGSEGEIFEVVQKMSDSPLTKHPQSGLPVQRLIQPPHLPGKWTDRAAKNTLSDKNLDRLGFTKYQRSGDGTFDKRAGSGPKSISAD